MAEVVKKRVVQLPRILKPTIAFLKKSGDQSSSDWLALHKKEHQTLLVEPLKNLALFLADETSRNPLARGYKFPRRGFGRLRRPSHKVLPGQPAYRDFVHLQASKPSRSIFDMNPGLYFYMSPTRVFAGGGLYEPSSRQIKTLRAWLAENPPELKAILKSKKFKDIFPRGLERDKILKTYPRAYTPDHPRIQDLRLQAYYVTREFTKKDLYSPDFAKTLLETWAQALRLNDLLFTTIEEYDSGLLAPIAPASDDGPTSDNDEDVAVEQDLWDDRL